MGWSSNNNTHCRTPNSHDDESDAVIIILQNRLCTLRSFTAKTPPAEKNTTLADFTFEHWNYSWAQFRFQNTRDVNGKPYRYTLTMCEWLGGGSKSFMLQSCTAAATSFPSASVASQPACALLPAAILVTSIFSLGASDLFGHGLSLVVDVVTYKSHSCRGKSQPIYSHTMNFAVLSVAAPKPCRLRSTPPLASGWPCAHVRVAPAPPRRTADVVESPVQQRARRPPLTVLHPCFGVPVVCGRWRSPSYHPWLRAARL